jgi:hypothetical protein
MTRPCTRFLLCCLWVALGGLGTACPSSTGNGQDSSGLVDLIVADQRTGDVDLRTGDLGPGDASAPDAAVADSGSGPDLTSGDVTLAEGPCSGRAGHTCSGQIGLYRTPSGALELRFPSNFRVSPIPAGEVYLSSRNALGSSINPGGTSTDVFLGTLQAFTGAQTYPVSAGTEAGRPYAWIWCRAATVEVGVAPLTSLP